MTLHNLLAVLAVVLFGVSGYMAPAPPNSWHRMVSFGLAVFAASFISWSL